MCVFYKVTRTDDDSIESSLEDGCVIIKSISNEGHKFDEHIVLYREDFEGMMWNYQSLQEEIEKKKVGK